MTRLTDNDRHLGRFITYARCGAHWRPLRVIYSSGGGDEREKANNLTVYAFGWILRILMPTLLRPWRCWLCNCR